MLLDTLHIRTPALYASGVYQISTKLLASVSFRAHELFPLEKIDLNFGVVAAVGNNCDVCVSGIAI